MSPVRVTWARTLGRSRGLFATALAVAGFCAAVAAQFAFAFDRAEGGTSAVAAIWAGAVSPVLPVLAALLAMGVWSDERQSGRMAELLSAPVRERDYVIGKFFGVWTMMALATIISLVSTVAALLAFCPSVVSAASLSAFAPALLVLGVQGALWAAASEAASAVFRHAAAAAAASVALLSVLPRSVWAGMRFWSQRGAAAFGEMPLDAHAVDGAAGILSPAVLAAYLAVACLCLLFCTKCVAANRMAGRGARTLRASTAAVLVLAAAVAVLAVRLAARLDSVVELPRLGLPSGLSQRTRGILAESSGEIVATCFLPRDDAGFRPAARLVRSFARASSALGGARIEPRYVDPRWDVAASERLAARGVSEPSLVLESGRRVVSLPLEDGCGERLFASAIRRLAAPPMRRSVYWTAGHGEAAPDGYGVYGLSDFARELVREGYRNAPLDLTAGAVPADCALVAVSGPREAFARVELDRLDAYLRGGGRLLALVGQSDGGGVFPLLASWGVQPVPAPLAGAKTLSGSDAVVSEFSDHPVSAPLKGSRIVMESPTAFVPSRAAVAGSGLDGVTFAPLATLGGKAVAAAAERGSGSGDDLAVRPMRIVAVGDATFALNGALASRANANRDFLLNCVAFLSGSDAVGADGEESGVLVSGLDRSARVRFAVVTSVVVPGVLFLVIAAAAVRRRLRA